MALDEPKDSDKLYEIDGFTYIVERSFMEKIEPVKVDFMEMGFKVSANVDFGGGCGSCNTSGSCCSS